MTHIATVKDITDLFACNIVSEYEESKPIEEIAIKYKHGFVKFDHSVRNNKYVLLYRTVHGDVYRIHGTEYIVKRMPYPTQPFTLSALRFDYYPKTDDVAHIDFSAHCRMVQYASRYHTSTNTRLSHLATPIAFERIMCEEPLRICCNQGFIETHDCVDWIYKVPGNRLNHHWINGQDSDILEQISKVKEALLAIGLSPCVFNEGCFHLSESRSGVKITFVAVEHLYIHTTETEITFAKMMDDLKQVKPNLHHVNRLKNNELVRDLHQKDLNEMSCNFIDFRKDIQYIFLPQTISQEIQSEMMDIQNLLPKEWSHKLLVPSWSPETQFVTYDASYDCRNLNRFRSDFTVMQIHPYNIRMKQVTKELLEDNVFGDIIRLQTLAIVTYTDHLTRSKACPEFDLCNIWFREVDHEDEFSISYQGQTYKIPIKLLEISMNHWCTTSPTRVKNPIKRVIKLLELETSSNVDQLLNDLIDNVYGISIVGHRTAYFQTSQSNEYLTKIPLKDSMNDDTAYSCKELWKGQDISFDRNIDALNDSVCARLDRFNLSNESDLFAEYNLSNESVYRFDLRDDNDEQLYLMQSINLADLTTEQIRNIMTQVDDLIDFLHQKELSLYTVSVGSFLISHEWEIRFHQIEHIYTKNDELDQIIQTHRNQMNQYLLAQSKLCKSRDKSARLRLKLPKVISIPMSNIRRHYWWGNVDDMMSKMILVTDDGYHQEYTSSTYRIMVYPVAPQEISKKQSGSVLYQCTIEAQDIYDITSLWISGRKSCPDIVIQHYYIGYHDNYKGSSYAYDCVYPKWSLILQELKETPCCMVLITDSIESKEKLHDFFEIIRNSKSRTKKRTIATIFRTLYNLTYLFVTRTKHYIQLRLEDVMMQAIVDVIPQSAWRYRKKNKSIVEYTQNERCYHEFFIHRMHKVKEVIDVYDAIDTMNEYLVTAYNELSQTKLSEVSELYDILFTTAA